MILYGSDRYIWWYCLCIWSTDNYERSWIYNNNPSSNHFPPIIQSLRERLRLARGSRPLAPSCWASWASDLSSTRWRRQCAIGVLYPISIVSIVSTDAVRVLIIQYHWYCIVLDIVQYIIIFEIWLYTISIIYPDEWNISTGLWYEICLIQIHMYSTWQYIYICIYESWVHKCSLSNVSFDQMSHLIKCLISNINMIINIIHTSHLIIIFPVCSFLINIIHIWRVPKMGVPLNHPCS